MQVPIHAGNLEALMHRSEARGGYAKQWPIPLGMWNVVTDEGDLAFGALETGTNDIFGFAWNATGTTDDYIVLAGQIPLDFDPDVDQIKFLYRVRKLDTTGSASDNADLALVHSLVTLGSGDTAPGTVTIANHVVATDTTDDDLTAFAEVEIDLSGNDLQPGDYFSLRIAPNEAIGTNLSLQLLGTEFRYMGNISFNDRAERNWN